MSEKWSKFLFLLKSVRKRLLREPPVAVFITMTLFVMVMASFLSLNRELTEGPQRYIKSVNVDNWITQKGATSLSQSSFIDPQVLVNLRKAGYEADGMLVYFNQINDQQGIYQSYEPGGILDPQLQSGRQVQTANEVVVDHLLASVLGVDIGDSVRLVNNDYKIVGLSQETNSIGKWAVFVNHEAMAQLVGQPTYQALAVRLQPNQAWPPSGVNMDGFLVSTQQQFLDSNLLYQQQTISPFIYIILLIAVITLTMTLFLLFAVEFLSRIKTTATLRLIGATRGFVLLIQLVTMTALAVSATLLAWPLSVGLITLANPAVPGISASILPDDLLVGFAACFPIGLLALIPTAIKVKRRSPVQLYTQAA